MGNTEAAKKKKVIVAGHSCLDLTPIFPPGTKEVANPGELLAPGKLVQMEGVAINGGGAVSNTGIAMKLLGADVSLLTKTGTDTFGKVLKDIYAGFGVADSVISVEGERTSYTTVIAMPGIDRILLHDPGCNNTFSVDDVKRADLTGVSLFHFGYPPIMERMYLNDGAELVEMLKYVKSQGVAVSMDMAMVDPASKAGQADWLKILTEALPHVDFFVPSVEEICFMLDRSRYEEWSKRAAGGELVNILRKEDIAPLAEKCMELGTRVLLLKCGAPGLYYKTGSAVMMEKLHELTGINASDWTDREGFENSYLPEKVLSGTGAGDTTIAAFLTAMLEGYSFERCIQLAAAEGASCVEAYGALEGIRSLEELTKRIDNGWEKGDGLRQV
ncbi:MAG: carbohydrate kinase family protein [Lachnospiraceae bacterium]|nr:carbohydrate kinase family protein [Lachnospiraceae bacterium]